MAENTVINPASIDFDGDQVRDLSEAIMTSAFNDPALNEFSTIIPGIVAQRQIAILGLLGKVGRKVDGQCAPDNNPSQIPLSQKLWNPAYIEDRFNQCWKPLMETFFIWGLKKGVKKPDLTNTDFSNFLEDRLGIAIMEAIYRYVWFGDVDAANYNDSPAGYITNSVDPSFFTAFDGYWKQIKTIVATTPAQLTAIPNNAGASYALQKFTPSDTTNQLITGIMQTMVDNADVRIFEGEEPFFIVTKSVADQYKRERRLATGIDAAYEAVSSGIKALYIDGYKVLVFHFLDRTIMSDENNGTKLHLPHRILFTNKTNLQVGVEDESSLKEIYPFYDEVKKEYNVDFGFMLDAKVIEDYKVQVAY